MKEDGKSPLVPKLRFPEFREAGDWREGMLINLSSEPLSNGVFNDPKKVGSGYKLINVSDMYIQSTIDESRLTLLELTPSEFEANQVITGDIFFTRSSLVKSGIAVSNIYIGISNDVTYDGHLIRFRPNTSKVIPLFAHNLFKTAPIRAQLIARGKTATMTTIGQADVASVTLSYPERDEQQKIAECLSSVDELMAAQSRKVDALKTHKKGLMEQLFPHEGETQPRLRFPEFQSAGEWQMKRLDELVDIQSGATPSKANPAFWNGSVPWVSAKDMKRLFLNDAEDHISVAAVDDGARLVPPGTLLMLTRGMTLLKDVPICVLRCEMSFNQDVKGLRPKDGVDGLFLAWILLGNKPRLLAMVNIAGHGTGKLDTEELKALELMLPPPAEQQRIADCLTSLDDLIAAQTQKLESLKTHKRGLMQQLFPSPENQS